MNIKHWIVKYDKIATRLAYSQIDVGIPESCPCEYCPNFVAVRDEVHPIEVLKMLEKIGIDYRKESEVFFCNKEDDGKLCYAGELCFVGSVENTNEAYEPFEGKANVLTFEDKAQIYIWNFSNVAFPRLSVFKNKQVASFYFSVRVPWVLQTKEPD
jgi:hypothetical protein